MLTGLLSFWLEATPTTGSVETDDDEKRRLAGLSVAWAMSRPKYMALFPKLSELVQKGAPHPARVGTDPETWLASQAAALALLDAQDEGTGSGGRGGEGDAAGGRGEDAGVAATLAQMRAAAAEAKATDEARRVIDAASAELADGEAAAALARLQRALKVPKAATALQAGRAELLALAGAAHAAAGDLKAAAAVMDEAAAAGWPLAAAAAADMRAAEAAKTQGNDAFLAGRFADAAALYSKGVSLVPRCCTLLNNAAAAAAGLGDHAAAEMAAAKALEVNVDFVKARKRRADALTALGRTDEAARELAQLR